MISVEAKRLPSKGIQGGMGVGVSRKELVQAVSFAGQELAVPIMGTLSGTGLGPIISRILQRGDPGGHYRKAFESFPDQAMAERVWNKYYIEGGKAQEDPYRLTPMVNFVSRRDAVELTICANYAEVRLAKQGHGQPVAVNYLEKVQTTRLPELFGAMLGGVDVVVMGAGIPDQVPKVLDSFAEYRSASYALEVDGRRSTDFVMNFNPSDYIDMALVQSLRRPDFYAIISSNVLAKILADERRIGGRVDGFIIEKPSAGGHNASPRDKTKFNERGEPVYGPKDEVNLEAIKELRKPFWLAGSYASPSMTAEAIAAGATGTQWGSIFALCAESGLREDIKQTIIKLALEGNLDILSDPNASPSGFPFNIVQLEGSMSDLAIRNERERICDIGYLRSAYRTDRGTVGFRCPAGPSDTFVLRGGDEGEALNKVCLCNNLLATIGLGQMRNGIEEIPVATLGRDSNFIRELVKSSGRNYTARDAIEYLIGNPVAA